MKKFFSFAIVAAAVAMVSCGGNATQPAAEAAEVQATEVVAPVVDTTAVVAADSTAVKAEACCAK